VRTFSLLGPRRPGWSTLWPGDPGGRCRPQEGGVWPGASSPVRLFSSRAATGKGQVLLRDGDGERSAAFEFPHTPDVTTPLLSKFSFSETERAVNNPPFFSFFLRFGSGWGKKVPAANHGKADAPPHPLSRSPPSSWSRLSPSFQSVVLPFLPLVRQHPKPSALLKPGHHNQTATFPPRRRGHPPLF